MVRIVIRPHKIKSIGNQFGPDEFCNLCFYFGELDFFSFSAHMHVAAVFIGRRHPVDGADGLAVDAEGRLYVASSAGVEVFDATGRALGVISLPKQPQNLAFAGPGKQQLFIVGRGAAWRIDTLAQGFTGRAK